MADHIQDQILDYFKQLLLDGGTAAGTNVEVERVDPVPAGKLPHLHIEAESEEKGIPPGQSTIGYPRTMPRFFSFSITATVAQTTGYGKAARTLGLQVEKLICATRVSQAAAGKASLGTQLMRTEFLRDGQGDTPAYAVIQHWTAGYLASDPAPDVPL